ncbi:Maf family nucleotide pyrophosphatase [Runella sp. MFBS21]|uniref:Maf family protein n=1 Tax=Runella sp. MFBS21 TaxID=3034018 RepID=UPI0023F9F203|nr:Maf family nucleotide pyrophosphatase [Runella sp. MFBS21]MDF7816158.1 Maf family nucleotide pyrophosphatase [Runella sp. MFBS21]
MINLSHPLILASNSPRRQQLLRELGIEFTVQVRPTDELFPADMPASEVAGYLAQHKAEQFAHDLGEKLILCADTVVVVDNEILNKPTDATEARTMLQKLSGREHQVITGICLLSPEGYQTISDVAKVVFKTLTESEIDYYITHYRPFDKAGAYGVQEWIGMIGISHIEGSFYTIMGLPLHKVYELLSKYATS